MDVAGNYTAKMMLRTTILALSLMLVQVHANREPDAFYVWQQVWSSNVFSAVSNEAPTTIYPIATVVPAGGNSPLVVIPWAKLATLKHRVVPTIRIPLTAFKRADIADELNRVTRQLLEVSRSCKVNEFQFDLDCPERLLPEYLKLLDTYRQVWPDLRLSITALPAHLNNASFRPLAEAVDYYVLQVHGLNVPQHLDDPSALLNLQIAKRAIHQAEALGRPYRIALPCYAYELNFDPNTGKFLFLTAEHPARRQETVKKRIAAKPEDLLKLLQESKTLKHVEGIIWFRLPVDGDRLCWPRAALAELQRGTAPTDRIKCRVHRISETTIELELFNGNVIHATTASLALHWPYPIGSYDLYEKAVADESPPAQLPTELTVPMPPPGQSIKIGWFQSSHSPETGIDLK